ncbi:restriction endonuclease [Rossellomorea aquimaris]|uniref:restriction endonuclease n=1 Tax=Rossellomorea aquimaris TaxID=189382 RepID=UPI001CD495D4|nr:restriction endonuclease [Rossellomorea aquimaris]MCA1060143.1 restriction endonuclease [Rossellomorea aquimaris]
MAPRYMYQREIKHDGLNKYRVIKGDSYYVVEQKALAQVNQWDEMWRKKKETEMKKVERDNIIREKEAKKELAIELTTEAGGILQEVENTLLFTLEIDDEINWESLKDTSTFSKAKPKEPKLVSLPEEPTQKMERFQPKLGFLDKIFSSMKQKKIDLANEQLNRAHINWEKEKDRINKKNQEDSALFGKKLLSWEEEKKKFLTKQEEKNKAIQNQKENYLNSCPTAIVDYCDMVLTNSIYPNEFPQEFDIDYNPINKILVIDYSLPSLHHIPTLKEVKYIQSKDEYKEVRLSATAEKKMYDNLLYQITLRSLHELFEADAINALESIVFNGWVKSVDKSTGQEVNACILSVQASKEEFMKINLSLVDPKLCFKNLKGIGSSKLHSISPIAPIIKIDRNDPRFVSSYDIADSINESDNLAAMDWQDFEHLIRELFEKEFKHSGGEVKVTQASKDGGVDAVAFDPDPIRGGKVVIQAKRYTNVVGVSAVRDLYGTLLNEGANKGVLVSTADYGPDAYEFAKGKPITLLSGNNLLHLLEKHGHRARIDLKEAKKLLMEKGLEAK